MFECDDVTTTLGHVRMLQYTNYTT